MCIRPALVVTGESPAGVGSLPLMNAARKHRIALTAQRSAAIVAQPYCRRTRGPSAQRRRLLKLYAQALKHNPKLLFAIWNQRTDAQRHKDVQTMQRFLRRRGEQLLERPLPAWL